jgi:hypothetical protein
VKFITEDDTINRILSLEKEVESDKYRANSIIEL